MNIFIIEADKAGKIDWVKSAQSQDNYRVVKMILESCQMLCTTLHLQGLDAPYKIAFKNHPCTKWVRESAANFEALMQHTAAMLDEYTSRFNKIHKCAKVLERAAELYDPGLFPSNIPTMPPLAMPDEFKSADIVDSYRRYYASKPRMRYPKHKVPQWFRRYRGNVPYQVI